MTMTSFSQQASSSGPDSSMDVEDETSKSSGPAKGKPGKGGEKVVVTSPAERAANVLSFMQKLIESVMNDTVLKDTALNL
jgi:hypothetical protein